MLVTWPLLQYMGIPQRYIDAQQRFTEQQRLFISINGAVGPKMPQSNGHGQGDNFAILATTAYMIIWTHVVSATGGSTVGDQIVTGGYFDDSHFLATGDTEDEVVSKIMKAKQASDDFDLHSGQRTNTKKSGCISNSSDLDLKLQKKTGIPLCQTMTLLGAVWSFYGESKWSWYEKRFKDAEIAIVRAGVLPLGFTQKCDVAAMGGVAKLYGLLFFDVPEKELKKLRKVIINATWGTSLGPKAPAAISTLLFRTHCMDPESKALYDPIVTMERYLRFNPSSWTLFAELWQWYADNKTYDYQLSRPSSHVVAKLLCCVERLGMTWDGPWILRSHFGDRIDWVKGERGTYLHQLRDVIRWERWCNGPRTPRPDMPELVVDSFVEGQIHVDYHATTALLRSNASGLTNLQKALLRTAMVGAVWNQSRLEAVSRSNERRRAKREDRPMNETRILSKKCPHCGAECEDTKHIIMSCTHPDLQAIRDKFSDKLKQALAEAEAGSDRYPMCWAISGIAVHTARELGSLAAIADEPDEDFPGEADGAEVELDKDGRMIVGGDGACTHQSFPTIRRAGYGVWWGPNHPYNGFNLIGGVNQTAQRGELRAYARVVSWAYAPVCYVTDSQLVVDLDEAIRITTPEALRRRFSNWDLVRRIQLGYVGKGFDFFKVQKVESHISQCMDIQQDEGLEQARLDKNMHILINTEADDRANQGAALHSLPASVADEVVERYKLTKELQRGIVQILATRSTLNKQAKVTPRHQLGGLKQLGEKTRYTEFSNIDAGGEQFEAAFGVEDDEHSEEDVFGFGCGLDEPLPSSSHQGHAQPTVHSEGMNLSAQNVVVAPCDYKEEHFPGYPWRQRESAGEVELLFSGLQLPVIGKVAHKSEVGRDTHWNYDRALLAPINWYFKNLKFTANEANIFGASWLELAIDFMATTLMKPKPQNRVQDEDDVFRIQESFADMSKRWFQLCGSHPSEFVKLAPRCPSTLTLELPAMQGWYRRPLFFRPQWVSQNMLNITRSNGRNKYLKDIGPCIFQLPSHALWSPPQADGSKQHRKRLRQKTPGFHLYNEPRDSISMPSVRGPSSIAKATHLNACDDWTEVEKRSIEATTQKHKLREMKRLRHNRTAREDGYHVIRYIGECDTRISCQVCPYEEALGQFSRWISRNGMNSRCFGAGDRCQQIVLEKRQDIIRQHNMAVEAGSGRHRIKLLDLDSTHLTCEVCGVSWRLTSGSFTRFKQEPCAGQAE